jgi:hypothetical protein
MVSVAAVVEAIIYAVVAAAVSYGLRALLASNTDNSIYRRGSQLDQLTLSSSSNGAFIAQIKGSSRVSGNIIWGRDLVRKTHISTTTVSTGGGKGGGGGSQTITNETYTYHATFAIALCLGPIAGVTRIYAANDIIYNVGMDADIDTLSKSLAFKNAHLTFYDGTDNQPIDPIIQSFLGADASAYRGVAYVVFNDWDVTQYAGIPPLSFEVVENGIKIGDQIQKQMIQVADVIQQMSANAGLAGLVDTGLVTAEANGLAITQVGNYRSTLDSLMDAYFLSAIESGGKIKFFDRNRISLLTIPADDLAASAGNPEKPVKATLVDEISLPKEVEVSYVDIDQNYQSSTQLRRTEYGNSNNKFALSFPLVLTATQARQIADTFNDLIWIMRIQYEFKLPLKYIELEPGDIVTIPLPGRNVDVYINRITLGANGVMEVIANHHDVSAFVSSVDASGSNISSTTGSIGVAGDSVVEFMNLPALSDKSNHAGFFAAVSGTNQNWFGAVVYRSVDGGVAFDPYFTVTSPTPTGTVDILIQAGRNRYFFDDKTTIDITLNDDFELESFNDSAILNGKNLGMFGNELIQFGNATKIGPKKYRLSRLLNARANTESEMANHIVGERFVLVSAANFIAQNNGEINRQYYYKVLSNGQNLADVNAFTFTNNGESLRPLSVIHVRGSRDGANNLTITWVRRSRVAFAWVGGAPVPLGETSEEYQVDILNGSNVVRTLAVNAESAVYSAADQAADFGSVQSSIDVNIYQISTIVGRGHVSHAVI